MKIGLSLSACVADIVAGRVKIDDVAVIVANTAHDLCTSNGFFDAHKSLCETSTPCRQCPNITWTVLQQLGGRIEQPRLRNPKHAHKGSPHWIDVNSVP